MQVLGTVVTSGTTTANRVQEEPNSARDAEANLDMEVDKNSEEGGITTDEEEGQVNDDNLIDYNDYNEDGTPTAAAEAVTKAAYLNDLCEQFANKGKEYRYRAFLKSEKVKDLYTSPMTMEMSHEDILSEIPTEDKHLVGVVRGMLIMPPSFLHKHLIPTIRMRDALKRSEIGEVPGGVETAIMFSFFDQSVLNLTKRTGENLADNSALRAMVNRARNDKVDHFALMKEGRNGLFKGAVSALKQIERAARLPNADKLSDMTDIEIESQNEEIAYAIKQHEAHVWRDHDDLLLIREQASLLANLAWEQQIHICNLNDKYLHLLEERKTLADMSHKPIYDSVDLMSNTMKDIANDTMRNLQKKINALQEALNQRHDDMSRLLTPVDITKIMDTMNKLN
jgi:hypothetical protein